MEKEIKGAIKLLAERFTNNIKSEDAMRFSQSMLNLIHVFNLIHVLGEKLQNEKTDAFPGIEIKRVN